MSQKIIISIIINYFEECKQELHLDKWIIVGDEKNATVRVKVQKYIPDSSTNWFWKDGQVVLPHWIRVSISKLTRLLLRRTLSL